ncbi:MAG: cell wall metabolism sensor histidine kinase WalK [Candidatus Omnitrophica bacterium]|nr:cell wall metabolism sensor histidine kinase WalK [Candidatus Omnitrophota bacterium]
MDSQLPIIFFIIIAIIAVAIGVLLVHLSKASAKAAAAKAAALSKKEGYVESASPIDATLKHTFFEEIRGVSRSMQDCQEVTSKLLDVVSREIEKKVTISTQEMGKKYEAMIEEKSKNEEIAWKKYEKVSSDKRKTEAVIHSIAEGLVVVDRAGNVVMMNPAAEKLLGAQSKEKSGRPLKEGLKDEQMVSLIGSGGEGKDIELVSQQDETKKILRASTSVIENLDGQTVGMVSVLSDVTKQRELDRMKETFLSNVSHELRTPLVAIDKSITLILSRSAGEITDNQEQFLVMAQRNLKRLSLLVNDLLDLSKLEAKKMELKRQEEPINLVVDEAVGGLESWAKTKRVHLEKNIAEGIPQVKIDHNRMIQVFTNLMGNALKFTPADGTITVEAKKSPQDHSLQVSVRDTGIGIDKEHLPKLFSKFYQAGEKVSTEVGGTGIGLTIAKEIVELHGGKIWVESQKGEGTVFNFTIPLN